MNKIKFITILVVATLLFSIISQNIDDETSSHVLKKDDVILAFGDSITYGYGVPSAFSYPSQLQMKTGLHVINAGVSGEESSEGLLRLPALLKQKPKLVILCHGGNDILRQRSHVKLKNNLLAMIKLIKNSGADVLLVGVPDFGIFGFKTAKLYSEVANETGVVFEEDILSVIESDRRFKSDNIHPNKIGYEMMADAFIERLAIE
ncbi:MAG: arylesterase [Sulfurimonas sp.]|uniref:arylesterase n=1 Tax=Sulfurimonas sp. TaxID=2022749 RepID=UPI00260FBC49|nr:arylesterase [Sulfurimonas sp.]MCW8896079.1 arylesterase [Sulfurimonas sp.]MCW8954556.1 arylesterase [Sulfurimonas sp.]